MNAERAIRVVQQAVDLIDTLREEKATLKDTTETLEIALRHYVTAVEDHNAKCVAKCSGGGNCGYEGYLKRTGRRCSQCPAEFKVDVMPTKGAA